MRIHWRAWSPRAFAEAEAGRKPVLLSLVTAWSDECAAMDESTYAHVDVVSLAEERFVPVRVDADRRPDINERYNLGGWPTTSFLTHRGDVLAGGTYFDVPQLISRMQQVADAYRERYDELSSSPQVRHPSPPAAVVDRRDPVDYFRALMLDRFDPAHGGFGSAPKLPHPYALWFGLSLEQDSRVSGVVAASLAATSALWDPVGGGFFRYAESADWSRPAAEKTLEDHAVLLHVFVEAALSGSGDDLRHRAVDLVRWVREAMSDQAAGGFFNAQTPRATDRTMYVDRNAMMIGAFIRAAALFDDIWLRDFALQSLEAVVVPAYRPGAGVGHVVLHDDEEEPERGLLTDQIHAASALIWAHAATGRLPYTMLAAELLQFALRTMWDEQQRCFRDRVATDDPVAPFELNCHAACVLDRFALLTGDTTYHDRALAILQSRAAEYYQLELFGAPYAVAVKEVVEGRRPRALELSRVDWGLG